MAGSLWILAAPWRARTCSACIVIIAAAASARALDCNGNSVEDELDIAFGSSRDCNSNRVPDECDITGHPVAFEESSFFETRSVPGALASEDLDGDGREDLAFISGAGKSIAFLSRRVAGFMEEEIALGVPAVILVAADLDGDGDLDLVSAGSLGVTVVENDGLGAFTPLDRIPVGSSPRAIAAADLDGDGDLDLMTANSIGESRPGNISVLRNEGGTLGDVRNYAAQLDPIGLVARDFDGDGDTDAAVANRGSSTVSVLANDGSGAFPGEVREDVDLGFSPQSLAAADLNGDGRVDLAVKAGKTGVLLLLENAGGGQYTESARIDVESEDVLVFAEDTDRDGDPDLIVGSAAITHLENDGRGSLLATRIAPVGARATEPGSLIAIDLDSDGDADLALGSKDPNGVMILGNHGSGAFDSIEYRWDNQPESLLVHDLDGDGDIDLLAADREHYERQTGTVPRETVDLFLNDGRGRLRLSSTFRLFQSPDSMAAGDLDGDGDTDVAVALHGYKDLGGETVVLLIQEGPGTFTAGKEVHVDCCPSGLDLADLDEDGDLDLIVRFEGYVYWYLNDGLAGFSRLAGAFPGGWTTVLARDLDGDAHVDICVLAPPSLHVFLNDGFANFVWHQYESGGSTYFACADLDHDGDPDFGLGFRHTGPTPPHVLWNDGAGAFHDASALDFNSRAFSVGAADLDGDGGAELVALSNTTNETGVYRWEGARLERTEDLVLMPVQERVTTGLMALSDMDSDGNVDLVAATVDGILIVRNRFERGSSPDEDRDGTPDECSPFLRGDADSSGVVDLTDAISILGALFLGNRESVDCERSADTDGTGEIDLTDAVFLLRHLFQGGDPPPSPYPACGMDPGPDGLSCASSQTCG